jgi:hypothetical protein
MRDDQRGKHQEDTAAAGTGGHFYKRKKRAEYECAEECDVTKAFAEPQHTREVSYFEQAGDKQAEDKKQKTEQIKYVFVALYNGKRQPPYHTEEQAKDGICSDQSGNKKKGDNNGPFLRLGSACDESQGDRDPHDGAGANRRQSAGAKNNKYRQKRRF